MGTETLRPAAAQAPVARSRGWWRRPWIAPLFVVSTGYIAFTALPYLDRETAPLMPHDGFTLYYPALITHIAFATVALLTSILQIWPWLRRRHPAAHRWGGRVYVLTTVVAGLLGLVIVPFAPPVGRLGVGIATTLWLAFSVMGFVRIRQRRYAEHRRLMLYAFAMVMNNLWGTTILMVVQTLRVQVDPNVFLEAARWTGWVANLLAVQWWLNRTAGRPVH
ncbi:hypothetical protein AMK16_30985 [Streptomyces sp. CB00455]|uniref:DUF2306 domain-containing protein n=1 Tax=Streptomyces sp. CB00455 TaxID=1703927 RepID=UPI0009393031|nr:DUF2306 domain-containing protein [Streptomyces sp. CB00455]OKK14332.1 hypothetical protein AMK16_30985 [Streptomyces sp. CB00455]